MLKRLLGMITYRGKPTHPLDFFDKQLYEDNIFLVFETCGRKSHLFFKNHTTW